MKKTVVLGASPNSSRYSFKAVTRLVENGYEVVPVGVREGTIAGKDIELNKPVVDDVHTVTLYLNPKRQEEYADYILSLKPNRIIFNPGSENSPFTQTAKKNGIETVENCTLVMLSLGIF